nr:MAG TPA: putative tail-component [Caudoviricetes sp.]
MADIEFVDNCVQVNKALDDAVGAFLLEASAEIVSAAARGSRVDSGQLKGSWKANVNESKGEAVIGSELENAIWEEFGTGEYAAKGDGRKGGWSYQDDSGNWHHTTGKKPNRTLQRAFDSTKGKIINRAKQIFKEGMK